MRRLPGLRLRFNLVVVPIVALGMAVMVWADYRHEYATLMEAHALHASVVGGVPPAGPLAPWSLPGPAVQRSLLMHVTYAGVLLLSLVLGLNVILHLLILRPVALMRQRLAGLERGHWRGPMGTTGDDELGSLHRDFQRLGPEIDALVGHALHAERLAMLALVSKRFEQHAEPEVKRIAEIASRLATSHESEARRDGEELARAAAGILKAVHAYDGAFARSSRNTTSAGEKTRVEEAV